MRGVKREIYKLKKKQAKVIKYIYSLYILDFSILEICKCLEKYNVPTPQGKTKWHYTVVRDILTNEKYKGMPYCKNLIQ